MSTGWDENIPRREESSVWIVGKFFPTGEELDKHFY